MSLNGHLGNSEIPEAPRIKKFSRFRSRLKISIENEIFERATHRGSIFSGEVETSRLKFSSAIKNFDRDRKFRSRSIFFDRWALWDWRVQGNPLTLCQAFANPLPTFSANPSPTPSFRGPQAPVHRKRAEYGFKHRTQQFFGAHRVPGSELSEFLSASYLCAIANSKGVFSSENSSASTGKKEVWFIPKSSFSREEKEKDYIPKSLPAVCGNLFAQSIDV